MEISFLDLRRSPGKLLEALKRKNGITLSRRGKTIARIIPTDQEERCPVAEHPAFGMWADHLEESDVADQVREMRKGRFGDR